MLVQSFSFNYNIINFLHIYKYAAYIWQCDSAWGYNNVNLGKSLYSKSESRSTVSNCLWPHGLYSPWNSPGQNTGVGSLSLLQGTFPTQGSNPGLPHCTQILYQVSHKWSPVLNKQALQSGERIITLAHRCTSTHTQTSHGINAIN